MTTMEKFDKEAPALLVRDSSYSRVSVFAKVKFHIQHIKRWLLYVAYDMHILHIISIIHTMIAIQALGQRQIPKKLATKQFDANQFNYRQ